MEDKEKRVRAFLTCLRSDTAPLLLDQRLVPQQFLLLACVLRYIMQTPAQRVVLTPQELDAVLATAFRYGRGLKGTKPRQRQM